MLWCCWLGSRKGIWPVKKEWWGTGIVICLERGADLHMAQLMPLPLTVSCSSKIQIGLPFWYRLTQVVLEKRPLNGCSCLVMAHLATSITLPFVFVSVMMRCFWCGCFVPLHLLYLRPTAPAHCPREICWEICSVMACAAREAIHSHCWGEKLETVCLSFGFCRPLCACINYINYTHTCLTALFPGLPRWACTRKVKINLDFSEARDSKWQWNQLGHMRRHLAADRQPRQHPTTLFFTGRMPFLPPNQQRQSTEGNKLY